MPNDAFEEEKWRIGLKMGPLEINGEEHEMKLHLNPNQFSLFYPLLLELVPDRVLEIWVSNPHPIT